MDYEIEKRLSSALAGNFSDQNYIMWYALENLHNKKLAFKYAKKFAKNCSPKFLEAIGEACVSVGDYKKAYKWFSKATKQGDARACYNLAYLYGNGLGVSQSTATQIALLKKSYKMGCEEAGDLLRANELI